MRVGRQSILGFTTQAGSCCVLLGSATHSNLVNGAEQAVVHHRINDLAIAEAHAGSCARQQVRGVGH